MIKNLFLAIVLLSFVCGLLYFFWRLIKRIRLKQDQEITEIRKAWEYLNEDMQRLANEIQLSAVKPLSQVGQDTAETPATESAGVRKIQTINRRLKNISHELAPQNLKKLGLVSALEAFLEETKLSTKVSFQHFGMERVEDFALQWHLLDVARSIVTHAVNTCRADKINLQLLFNDNGIVVALDQNGTPPSQEDDQFLIARNAEKLYAIMQLFQAKVEVSNSKGEMNCVRLKYPKQSLAA